MLLEKVNDNVKAIVFCMAEENLIGACVQG
jgi:hypothetical protein